MISERYYRYVKSFTGADPGFPVGGGANPAAGALTYDFAKFSEKLREIKKIQGIMNVK